MWRKESDTKREMIKTDVLIIGKGLAGLVAANAVVRNVTNENDVYVVTLGMAASFGPHMSRLGFANAANGETHYRETKKKADGLADDKLMRVLCERGWKTLLDLETLGVGFISGGPVCFGYYTYAVTANANDVLQMIRPLSKHVRYASKVIRQLIVQDGRCLGAIDATGNVISAKAVILATGGGCGIYSNCYVPSTGHGYVMALRAGCELVNMDMIQFIPGVDGKQDISVVVRNAARLTHGPFSASMNDHSGDIALYKETQRDGSPVHYAQCFNGGVVINENCETQVKGLYACGEVAGGVHGADRLGGNAQLAALVFGKIAGEQAAQYAQSVTRELADEQTTEPMHFHDLSERRDMFFSAGIVRSAGVLAWGIERTSDCLLAQAMLQTMQARRESRGAHYREDFPDRDDEFSHPIKVKLAHGQINVS